MLHNIDLSSRSHSTPHPAGKACPEAVGYPLVGVLPQLFTDAPGELQKIVRAHAGAVVALKLGPARVYLVSHPDHIQYMLSDNWRNFVKGPMWEPIRLLGGNGVATSDGESWL